MKKYLMTGAMVLALGAAPGCSGNDDGTLVQNWTIAGGTNPDTCTQLRASQMRLIVLDSAGFITATQFAPCTSFSTALSLSEDLYSASATFLDANNVVVSKTLLISRFNVVEDRTTTLNVPFTVTDFL